MKSPSVRPLAALGALALAASSFVLASRGSSAPPAPASAAAPTEPLAIAHFVDGARALVPAAGQVFLYNPSATEEPIRLVELRVVVDGVALVRTPLERSLPGDPRFGALEELAERFPEELSHRHGPRRFADPDAPTFAGLELSQRWEELRAELDTLREAYRDPARVPFAHLDFVLPLDQVFAPEEPPGTERELHFEIDYVAPSGALETATDVRTLRRLARVPGVGAGLATQGTSTHVHPGDLHVHSCHGEAVGACAPSGNCVAETFQTSGSFSYAQLKTQFQALGYDWMAATDHSYCIDSPAEYATITAELAALHETGTFLTFPDIELSSDEAGPQDGTSDAGDLACLGTTPANHMGAHGVSSFKAGGSQGFLGFCNGLFGGDALASFLANVDAVRAEGGWPIVNHPTGSFGWQSFASTLGIEANELHGVEIWNGATQTGQGGHVGAWVDWLLAGRVLYAYSGSDTHDAAFGFGANHVVLRANEPFDGPTVQQALVEGRVFLSDGHRLESEVVQAGVPLPMGTIQGIHGASPADALSVRALYDFGADTARITIFRGREGDAGEQVLLTTGDLSGSGSVEIADVLTLGRNSWYRAYSEQVGGAGVSAYANPVFFVHGNCAAVPYGVGLGGANIGTLSSPSAATIGSVARFDVSGFPNSPAALLALSPTQFAGGLPLLGGFALVGLPDATTVPLLLAGGSGSVALAIPRRAGFVGQSLYFQAGTIDPTQPQDFAFTNGLALTFCAIGQ